jgi:hypothetical protein
MVYKSGIPAFSIQAEFSELYQNPSHVHKNA